jgi:hypothetical protein
MLVGLAASVGSVGCSEQGGERTVTVEKQVVVEKPAPKNKKQKDRNPPDEQTASSAAGPEFVNCDPNIRRLVDTTTCEFAQNTFWTYWMSNQSRRLWVWSPAAKETFATTCEGDGVDVTCTTGDGGVVKFTQTAVDRYSDSQAAAYAAGHDLGPDPYEGLALAGSEPDYSTDEPDYYYDDSDDYTAPGENIPNYENGRGYRVQCADGTYSHSGGIQGACSWHGGVAD